LTYNTFFNKKVFINQNGEVYNQPGSQKSFGNINNKSILDISLKIQFQDQWLIKKDDIDVCKDCEYRYMCVDARIVKSRTDGSHFFPYECNYNPYICKWKGEEGYKTLAECGVICDASGYSIDEEKIAEINETLWAE
jgi:radical SAM protein with 4Fe4S-binding SPASM domain